MLLAGYILDEDDFEVIPTINRAMVMSEIELADGVTTPITDPKKGKGCVVATQGNVIVKNTNNTILSIVTCGENYVAGNSLVFNSGNTYSQIVPATVNLELPNITHIDSDGNPVTLPAQTPFTATTCSVYQVKSDWVSGSTGNSISYIGYSLENTPVSATTWDITKIDISTNGTIFSGSATGSWNDRYILIYT